MRDLLSWTMLFKSSPKSHIHPSFLHLWEAVAVYFQYAASPLVRLYLGLLTRVFIAKLKVTTTS